MISVEQHLAAALAGAEPLSPRRVPLAEAHGLVLAEDAVARVSLPGFDNSAMDGYAVRSADVATARRDVPATAVRLQVLGQVTAGAVPAGAVGAGQAMAIMTGAMVPEGADAVVKVEDTDGWHDDEVQVSAGVPAGTSIRRAGEDVAAGSVVQRSGALVTERVLALLAATGHEDALVHPRPRVAVVSTGTELAPLGAPLRPGQVYDSNQAMIDAQVRAAGAVTAYRTTVGDDTSTVRALLTQVAEQVDLVVTTGGVSMGAADVVKEVLRDLGTVDFVQVAMQPGKPQGLGRLGSAGVPVFGLPGNPVSAYVSFEVFVRPVLRRLAGHAEVSRPIRSARLTEPLRSPAGRRQFARARVSWQAGEWRVEPVSGQHSHLLADLAAANALLVIPEDVSSVAPGDTVTWMPLDVADGRLLP